jgi:hypothetical protein
MKPQGWAATGAAVATVALTAGAFWLSYEHLHDVSAANGLTGSRAWAWPACLDLFIMIGELLMLRASIDQGGMDWWAVGLMVTGSGGSIALNVAGVGSNAPTLAYVVAGVPPVAALMAFGALMRQVHNHLAIEPEPEAEPMDAHFRTAAELTEVPTEPGPVPITLERVPEAPLPALGPWTPVAELLAATPTATPVAPVVAPVALLTVADVAETKGVAEGTVRSWVKRDKLAAAERDSNGRLLFHPDAVAALGATP